MRLLRILIFNFYWTENDFYRIEIIKYLILKYNDVFVFLPTPNRMLNCLK